MYCACISHNIDFVESCHLAVALDAEPAAGVLRVDDVDELRSEAGGAHEAAVDVVAGGVLAAVVAGDSARVDDADALRNGLRNVLPNSLECDRKRIYSFGRNLAKWNFFGRKIRMSFYDWNTTFGQIFDKI